MSIGVKFTGGGCKCTDINNARRQASERFGTSLSQFSCAHTHSMAGALRKAKKKGKKRSKKAA